MATEVHDISPGGPATGSGRLSTPEATRVHLRLAQSLQTSLDERRLLELFFRQIQNLLPVKGLEYQPAGDRLPQFHGTLGRHRIDYRLTCERTPLGQMVFSRDSRFSDAEQQALEQLLSTLVFPLRNALQYQNAVRMALVDALTGLGNRTALDNGLRRELQLAERHKHDLSLMVVDLDNFKAINDQHGHSFGDRVLRRIAETLQSVSRDSDMSYRYGGEEFVVLLNNTDSHGAQAIAERLHRAIGKLNWQEGLAVTVSIGISTRHSSEGEHVDGLFDRADRALYQAKSRGRNCTVVASATTKAQA